MEYSETEVSQNDYSCRILNYVRKVVLLKIARVFPRQTKATPDDKLCFLGLPKSEDLDVDEVHISIAFTYDKAIGEYMAQQWYRKGYKVKLGRLTSNNLLRICGSCIFFDNMLYLLF